MQQKEWEILSELRKNAKTSLASISEKIKMPVSTVYDKINKMQKSNLITKNVALVNYSKLGYNHHHNFLIKVNHSEKKDLSIFLKESKCVNSLFETNGNFDFIVEIIHKNIKDYLNFADKLKESFNIMDMQELQVIDELKKEDFLVLEENEVK
jgi:DNA-binding Lrp family transcriptional regulator